MLARLHEWVVTVDHKRLGIMYVGVGLVFLLVAGLEATLMRWQLAFPDNTVLSPQVFNRLFTMHGTTMVFFVGIPIVFGFANYLVPLMIGTRDLAFPRLNALGSGCCSTAACSSTLAISLAMVCTVPVRRRMWDGSPTHR